MNDFHDIPFEVESIESMRNRWNKALEPVLDINYDINRLNRRDHTFDFSNGMRLTVTRDLVNDEPTLHLSCHVRSGSLCYYSLLDIDDTHGKMMYGTRTILNEIGKIPQKIDRAVIRSTELLHILVCSEETLNKVTQGDDMILNHGRFFWAGGSKLI